ncbi:VOC family protein [Leifsonia sp. YIM 134122]|uniref:VOC family protein n=1 Tax=Leifsonia stereocauli TaxID=3134136 RepID=A0ABU9W8F2_9MICO
MTTLNPYLSFRDTAREALEFYHSVFGGELTLSTYEEFHASEDPAELHKIMHGQLESGGMTLMAADTPNAMELTIGDNVTVSLSGQDEAELRGYWAALSEGATITLPLEVAPWGDAFGQLTDRFGTKWMFNIGMPAA